MRIEGQGAEPFYPPQQQQTAGKTVKVPGVVLEKTPGFPAGDSQLHEKLDKAVELINETLKVSNRNLKFQLHEASGRYQVKVLDSDSGEVIREIPAERMLEFSAQVKKMLNDAIGILFDEIV